ncbi:hypothetical protein ACE1B6_19760 [Aerosakkonemataceae cyanobacterium BLCC-F154]|uniref:Uncharacterized protein n=1 Tax=Floridaenema fluviatile BLCC-F154 TaxID=3153640 RepID=A0ABV4YF83_9CYAN
MNSKTLLSLLLAANSNLLIPVFTNAATLESISENNSQVERATMQMEIREINQRNPREIILSNRDNQDFNNDYDRDQGRGRRRR